MKKCQTPYYVGIDLGTSSIGYAVTDEEYNIIKFRNQKMIGVRLFEEAKTAAERRGFRSARRRKERRKLRIKTLQSIFSEEIAKKDFSFFLRLSESSLVEDDLTVERNTILFNDPDFDDKDYYKLYPTIYHLRKALFQTDNKADIRLLYLACHHIIKYRGNFLYENIGSSYENDSQQFFNLMYELNNCLSSLNESDNPELVDLSFNLEKIDQVETVITDYRLTKAKKAEEVAKLLSCNKRQKLFVKAMVGLKVKLSDLFDNEEYKEADNNELELSKSNYEEIKDGLLNLLGEDFIIIDHIQSIYTWLVLKNLLKDNNSISEAMVKVYEKHQNDLMILKRFIKNYLPEQYDAMFKEYQYKNANYCAYIGTTKVNGKKISVSKVTQEDFYKYIKKIMGLVADNIKNDDIYKYIISEIETDNFLPKQVSVNNSYIPHQINLQELKLMLEIQSKYYPFLNEQDKYGSIKDKICKLLTFRIPYFIGPLGRSNQDYSWKVRRTDEYITPWNIEEVVDYGLTMEAFIRRLTNKCTYLPSEDVLPRMSLLYSEYCVLNELNKVKVGGNFLSIEIKNLIFEKLFKTEKNVKDKHLRNFLYSEGYIGFEEKDSIAITGYQKKDTFASSLSSYISFKKIIGDKVDLHRDRIERIIEIITIYDDNKVLEGKLRTEFSDILTDKQIKIIKGFKFTGWASFSKKLLVGIVAYNKETGEFTNIINLLRNTNMIFMEIYHHPDYNFEKIIAQENNYTEKSKITYDDVKELYCSPPVKRSIWQAILIVEEIEKIMGRKPEKVFVESTRSNKAEKGRTLSRKNFLKNKLSVLNDPDSKELLRKLEFQNDQNLRKERLFLYFLQKGKCMYSGETISLSEIGNTELYDIDHIIPRALIKDDGISNKVLVKKIANQRKKDSYPVNSVIYHRMISFWSNLLESGLIESKKYERLTRRTPFSVEEQAGFINRQIVETSQSIRSFVQLLNLKYPDTEIVYSKAENVSDFRQYAELPKLREINDFHHAKDAYLNIVVGNLLSVKFGKNPKIYLASNQEKFDKDYRYKYNFNKLYDRTLYHKGKLVWGNGVDAPSTKKKVVKEAYDNRVIVSRMTAVKSGQFYDQNMIAKKEDLIPIRNDQISQKTEIYGGYRGICTGYFFVVESTVKNKREITIETVPVMEVKKIGNDINKLVNYCVSIGLIEPRILCSKIPVYSLVEYNQGLYFIVGISSARIIYHNAKQMCAKKEMYEILKKIVRNFVGNLDKPLSDLELNKAYYFYKKELITTYQNVRPFASTIGGYLEADTEKFLKLSLFDKCRVILSLLQLTQANSLAADLTLLGRAQSSGTIKFNKTITDCSFSVITQSVTGLFSNVKKIV